MSDLLVLNSVLSGPNQLRYRYAGPLSNVPQPLPPLPALAPGAGHGTQHDILFERGMAK